ncbi:hypothetical protein O0L34_g10264 [Tuta absoluta]|nr:hypothetical protein O0L34_g10264 [Tuta absoluta]
MALKLKYTDEHGILHINMSPSNSPSVDPERPECRSDSDKTELNDPQFDTINNRFGQYDLFGAKYEKYESGDAETQSLFRSRYNSIEEELASTPYAFTTERTLRFNAHSPLLDITIERGADVSPSKDIEDDRFFNRKDSLFGPSIDFQKSSDEEKDLLETPAFTVTQLIHAQDRYFDLSSRQSTQVSQSSRSDRVKSASEVRTVVKPDSVVKRPVTEKRGVGEVKRGVTEVKRGVTEVKRGVTEVKSGATEVKRGVGEVKQKTEVKQRTEALQGAKEKDNEAFRVLSAQTSVKAVQVDSTPVQIP